MPKSSFKKSSYKLLRRLFFRLDYLPPTLPPEMLARPTIWQQLEQLATEEILLVPSATAPSQN